MKVFSAIGNLFTRMVNAITWKNTVMAIKFLNVTDAQTGQLAPPKLLAWFISVGICYAMFKLGEENMDLGLFAGAVATLVGAFAAAYKLAMEGDKDDDCDTDHDHRKRKPKYEPRYGVNDTDDGPTP